MRPNLLAMLAIASLHSAGLSEPSAPTCPHCGQRVGASLDEQHRHATGRCVTPNSETPNRARSFLDTQHENIKRGREIKRRESDQRQREHEARMAADSAAAAARIERAIAKRQRKAQRQRGAE